MARTDQKKLEDIADGLMDSFPVFFRKVSRVVAHPGTRKFDPSRFVLKAVHMHGSVRMSEIGRHMGISKPYMTALVDKLIEDGLVERVPDPSDRRAVIVRITGAGEEELKGFTGRMREAVIMNLSTLDAKDISALHAMVKEIRGIVLRMDRGETEDCNFGKDD